jgi:hypothetical protein
VIADGAPATCKDSATAAITRVVYVRLAEHLNRIQRDCESLVSGFELAWSACDWSKRANDGSGRTIQLWVSFGTPKEHKSTVWKFRREIPSGRRPRVRACAQCARQRDLPL